MCPSEKRFLMLFTFLKKNRKKKMMVFFSSCMSVKYHHELLNYIDIPVMSIHVSFLFLFLFLVHIIIIIINAISPLSFFFLAFSSGVGRWGLCPEYKFLAIILGSSWKLISPLQITYNRLCWVTCYQKQVVIPHM